jgi:hypothetical protein
MVSIDIAGLRQAVQKNRYILTRHAQQRMGLRQVSHDDIRQVMAIGDVIEEYPEAKPFPKVLFMKHRQGEPLYVSCAFDGTLVYVITVHRYDPARWHDPWTRR